MLLAAYFGNSLLNGRDSRQFFILHLHGPYARLRMFGGFCYCYTDGLINCKENILAIRSALPVGFGIVQILMINPVYCVSQIQRSLHFNV